MAKSQYDDYDKLFETYQEHLSDYNDRADVLALQYEDGVYTEVEYNEIYDQWYEDFYHNNEYYINAQVLYYFNAALFFIIGFMIFDYTQNVITKGRTLGRRSMKIELAGKVTWWTLFLREVMFKTLFWIVTLSAGIAIDFGLIAFTSKKKTMRDYLTETYVVYSGASYPF